MKFNYKKIATVIGSALMVGSTIGMAAAAYPAPFVSSSGVGDVAVVVGSTATVDMGAATKIAENLKTKVTATSTSTATISGEGDKVKIEKNSIKLNLNDSLTDVWGTALTKSDLPVLLADGTYRNKNNDEYKYTQKIDLGNIRFTQFQDSDLNNKVPTLGFNVASNGFIANYTITFTTKPESVQGTDLTDFENTNLKILGKEYFILDFKNSTAKMTLLDSANTAVLNEGEKKTIVVGDKSYEVAIAFISDNSVKFTVNGETTNSLSSTANTYKLTDGSYIGVKEINVQNYAGGVKNVEFSIGKGKLEMTDGSEVKLNDKTISGLTSFITLNTASGKRTIDKIVLSWIADDKTFLTSGKELILPGFEAFKYTMADTTVSAKENTVVEYSSDDVIQLKTSIKGGDVTIPLLYMDTTNGNFTGIGKSATEKLMTSATSELIYNATDSSNRFIVSWANARDSETYYLKATVTKGDTTQNSTDIYSYEGGNWVLKCEDLARDATYTCSLGNAELTVNSVIYSAGGLNKVVNMTVNSGGSFSNLYTKEGLLVHLPYSAVTGVGSINLTTSQSYTLNMSEEDKNGDLDKKSFTLTLASGTSSGTRKVSVTGISGFATSTGLETASSSKLWENYVYSDLATKLLWDKTSSDQWIANIEYHGSEMTGNVYVAAPSVSAGSAAGVMTFKDSEVTSFQGNNLIVVGGSCINTVAAKLLGSETPICGADFTAKTTVGAGQFIVQTMANPWTAGKVAMLVAGFEQQDTAKAATYVTTTAVDTTVGKSEVKTTSTVQDLA